MAFTGKATYDQVDEQAEDVSPIVGMISPFETPLLDRLGDPQTAASNVLHEWQEDSLGPGTITVSAAVNSASAATTIHIDDGGQLQPGDLLRSIGESSLTYEEVVQVTAVAATSITVNRGVGSVGPSSLVAGGTYELIASAALEGADANDDISGLRTRQTNYTQIFAKPIQVSGTKRAVSQVGGVTDEMDYQRLRRIEEITRDLERATILGVLTGNTFGTSSAYRTMNGIRAMITTNAASIATLNESWLNNMVIKTCWDAGGNPDVITAGGEWKDEIDGFADSRIQHGQDEDRFRSVISRYEGSFANCDILRANRWQDSKSLLVLESGRIEVKNLQGRSFQTMPLAKTGDSTKEEIVGEYTLELRNENAHAKAYESA